MKLAGSQPQVTGLVPILAAHANAHYAGNYVLYPQSYHREPLAPVAMTIHQLVPVNYLNRFPSDILIYVFIHLGHICHDFPLYLYGIPPIRL